MNENNALVTADQALAFRQEDLSKYSSIGEAWQKCKIGFNVVEQPIYRANGVNPETGKPIMRLAKDYKMITRSDNNADLGIVGSGFQTLQPYDQLRVFEPLLESGYFDLDQGFTLQGGKKVIIQVALKNGVTDIIPGDPVKSKLSLVQGLDGSLRASALETTIRIVCANTLAMAISQAKEAGRILSFKHTASLSAKIDRVAEMVKGISERFNNQVEAYRLMAAKPINRPNQAIYFADSLGINYDPSEITKLYSNRTVEKLESLVERGRGASIRTRGTVWGAYNAVTEYLDHERGRTVDSGLTSSWFGPGKDVRAKATKLALEAINTIGLN